MIICGVDDAGRGSMIGPLVISGVIINKKNIKKVKKYFSKEFQPYEIGFISKGKFRSKTYGKVNW